MVMDFSSELTEYLARSRDKFDVNYLMRNCNLP
jgi:hypothetical protein